MRLWFSGGYASMIAPLVFQCLHVFVVPRVATIGRGHGDSIWSLLPNRSGEECRCHESDLFRVSRRTTPHPAFLLGAHLENTAPKN